jgi:hypothetical protein
MHMEVYSGAVVVAKSAQDAVKIHPNGTDVYDRRLKKWVHVLDRGRVGNFGTPWPENPFNKKKGVSAFCIGTANARMKLGDVVLFHMTGR